MPASPSLLPINRVGAALALVTWAVTSAHGPKTRVEGVLVSAPVEAPTWVVDMRDTPEGRLLMGKDLVVPKGGLKGQVPSKDCPEGYTVIGKGCWIRTIHTPPCPPTVWRHEDGCYLPLMAAKSNSAVGRE